LLSGLLVAALGLGCGGSDDPVADAAPSMTVDARPQPVDATLPAFERFRRTIAYGPCPPEGDCDGFVAVTADGSLNINLDDDPTNMIYEAVLTDREMKTIIQVVTAPALLELLDNEVPPCDPPTDIVETMTVVVDGSEFSNMTTSCENQPLMATRALVDSLIANYATIE